MLAVLALLAGIVAMHAGVFTLHPGDSHHSVSAAHEMAAEHATAVPLAAADTGCGAECDTGHAGLHGCVFILTALGLALLLVLLYYVAADRAGGLPAAPRHWRAERERPPPWTVLSLAELSILRI